MTQLEKALALCKKAHSGQFRKDGVTPYSTHRTRVAELVHTEEEKIVALLHDVLEDTDVTKEEIIEEFGHFIGNTLHALTKSKNETYENYMFMLSWDPLFKKVKIADIIENLCDNPSEHAKKKYFESMKVLL